MEKIKKKKTTVDLTPDNLKKMEEAIKTSGKTMTQSEFVNNAIAKIPIIILGDGKLLAESFFEIHKLMENETNLEVVREEVNKLCQSLFLLTEEIQKNHA